MPLELAEEYIRAAASPSLIHYCDTFKPWSAPALPNADKFWQYARISPFYEEILFSNILEKARITAPSKGEKMSEKQYTDLVKQSRNYPFLYLQYTRYKVMASLTFGEKKKHYIQKRNIAKKNITAIRQILKNK